MKLPLVKPTHEWAWLRGDMQCWGKPLRCTFLTWTCMAPMDFERPWRTSSLSWMLNQLWLATAHLSGFLGISHRLGTSWPLTRSLQFILLVDPLLKKLCNEETWPKLQSSKQTLTRSYGVHYFADMLATTSSCQWARLATFGEMLNRATWSRYVGRAQPKFWWSNVMEMANQHATGFATRPNSYDVHLITADQTSMLWPPTSSTTWRKQRMWSDRSSHVESLGTWTWTVWTSSSSTMWRRTKRWCQTAPTLSRSPKEDVWRCLQHLRWAMNHRLPMMKFQFLLNKMMLPTTTWSTTTVQTFLKMFLYPTPTTMSRTCLSPQLNHFHQHRWQRHLWIQLQYQHFLTNLFQCNHHHNLHYLLHCHYLHNIQCHEIHNFQCHKPHQFQCHSQYNHHYLLEKRFNSEEPDLIDKKWCPFSTNHTDINDEIKMDLIQSQHPMMMMTWPTLFFRSKMLILMDFLAIGTSDLRLATLSCDLEPPTETFGKSKQDAWYVTMCTLARPGEEDTVEHVSWRCTKYQAIRAPLLRKLPQQGRHLPVITKYAALILKTSRLTPDQIQCLQETLVNIWQQHIRSFYAEDVNDTPPSGPIPPNNNSH